MSILLIKKFVRCLSNKNIICVVDRYVHSTIGRNGLNDYFCYTESIFRKIDLVIYNTIR